MSPRRAAHAAGRNGSEPTEPTEPAESPLRPRGSRQGGLRQYNERVVLQAVRLHGTLPSADIARLTQLTPQTVSLISKRLVDEGLMLRGEPVRGKVGQPSVPLRLNPEGAFSIGIKVGRRSLDVLLVNFNGQPQQRWTLDYAHADPAQVTAEIRQRLQDIHRHLGAALSERVQGVGIAAPLAMGGWQQLLNMPPEVAAQWNRFDLRAAVAEFTPWPVTLIKDTAAACVAELVQGQGRVVRSYLYVFVDTFIGGGLVLDGRLRRGRSGNAGAVGSLLLRWPGGSQAAALKRSRPVRGTQQMAEQPPTDQLLGVASLLNLEQAYRAAGLEPQAAADPRALQPPWLEHTQAWLQQAAQALAHAINSAACLLDMDCVILDGSFDRGLLEALLNETALACQACSWEGVALPPLRAGSIGSDARALGGALLPLYANFALDHELFLKEELA